MAHAQVIPQSIQSQTLPEVLERVLDKGLVIAGDIRIKLCDIELLSIQIRLLVCSVEKAREMGLTWWWQEPAAAAQTACAPPIPAGPLPAPAPQGATSSPPERRFQEVMRAVERGPR